MVRDRGARARHGTMNRADGSRVQDADPTYAPVVCFVTIYVQFAIVYLGILSL